MHCFPSTNELYSWPLVMTDIAASSLSTKCLQPFSSTSATKGCRAVKRPLTHVSGDAQRVPAQLSGALPVLMPISIPDMFDAVSQSAISVERRTCTVDDPRRRPGSRGKRALFTASGVGSRALNQGYFVCAIASQAEMRQCQGSLRFKLWAAFGFLSSSPFKFFPTHVIVKPYPRIAKVFMQDTVSFNLVSFSDEFSTGLSIAIPALDITTSRSCITSYQHDKIKCT